MKQVMEKRNPVLDAMERQGILKGRKEGRREGMAEARKETLKVLNDLANDSTNDYTVDDLAKKYGYSVDEILDADTD